MEECIAVIVAAGRGSRMDVGSITDCGPKQYRKLGGSSVIQMAVNKFVEHPTITGVVVVIHSDDESLYEQNIQQNSKLLTPVFGGETRQQSIFNALQSLQNENFDGMVLIHDAARPLIDTKTIDDIISQIKPRTGVLPACAVSDTLKKVTSELHVTETIMRDGVFAAQTPQGFIFKEIYECHHNADSNLNANFTDDASMFEAAGYNVKIVITPETNFKITTSNDLDRARQIVAQRENNTMINHADIRVGNGYDVHAFAPGDAVILGGISIPFDRKLKGHSDADVVLHALTDALLGTIGQGDIGSHFPPSDPMWKNADSKQFLLAAMEMVSNNNGVITNLDVTIICEAPKIGPHRDTMRRELSKLACVDLQRISIKATTNEKMGFLGRGEGIAAIANATVSFGMIK